MEATEELEEEEEELETLAMRRWRMRRFVKFLDVDCVAPDTSQLQSSPWMWAGQ